MLPPKRTASACHKGKPRDITYKIKGLGDAVFSHARHIAKTGGACKSCHNGKVITGKGKPVTMSEMEKGKTCGACHNAKKAFSVTANCERCHKGVMKPKDIVFKIPGVTPATFSHAIHTAAFQCKECHTKTFPYKAVVGKASMDDMEKGKSCGTCHNGKEVFATTGDCAKCHKGMKPQDIVFKLKVLPRPPSAMISIPLPTPARIATPRPSLQGCRRQGQHGRYGKREVLRHLPQRQRGLRHNR